MAIVSHKQWWQAFRYWLACTQWEFWPKAILQGLLDGFPVRMEQFGGEKKVQLIFFFRNEQWGGLFTGLDFHLKLYSRYLMIIEWAKGYKLEIWLNTGCRKKKMLLFCWKTLVARKRVFRCLLMFCWGFYQITLCLLKNVFLNSEAIT